MLHLAAGGVSCPKPVANKQGSFVSMVELPAASPGVTEEDDERPAAPGDEEPSHKRTKRESSHAVRLLTYLEGVVWDAVPQVGNVQAQARALGTCQITQHAYPGREWKALCHPLNEAQTRTHLLMLPIIVAHAQPPETLQAIGKFVGQVVTALESFDNEAAESRSHSWDVARVLEIEELVQHFEAPEERCVS